MTEENTGRCSCKVGRVAGRYGLDRLDDDLLHRRREGDASLRALADYVNRRILAAALDDADLDDGTAGVYGAVSDEEAVSAVYRALAADAEPERTARVRTRLEQAGVDVDAVTDHWVTHPTVRHHLRECLGIDTGRDSTITLDDAVDTTEWARARCARVVARTFERLDDAGLVTTESRDVSVTIQVTCTACGNSYRPTNLVERGGCACDDDVAADGESD